MTAPHTHGRRWCSAFVSGLRRHDVSIGSGQADLLVMWGVRAQSEIHRQKKTGDVCVLECGYVGDRLQWASVSRGGGLNGRGIFGPCQDDGQRFARMATLAPWRRGGERAVILGQCSGDMSVAGMDLAAIYTDAAAKAAALGYEVDYRPHPVRPLRVPGLRHVDPTEPIEAALPRYALAVTVNSNAGVDAALAGVPVVALDRGSMAWDVAAHEIVARRPDRQRWAAHLAWKQWTIDEIARGDAWAALARS